MEKDSLIEGWEEDMILSDESDLNDNGMINFVCKQ